MKPSCLVQVPVLSFILLTEDQNVPTLLFVLFFLDLVVKLGQYMIFKTDTILIPIFGSKEFSILAVILFLLDTRHKKIFVMCHY